MKICVPKKQKIAIIYIKDRTINVSTSDNTQRIREKVNSQIKELGDKYYKVKGLFNQLNLRHEHLFAKAKELEFVCKDKKAGIKLQTENRRLKESLICWYTKHFYDEIFGIDPNFVLFLKKEANYIFVDQKKIQIPDPPKKTKKKTNDIFPPVMPIIDLDSQDISCQTIDLPKEKEKKSFLTENIDEEKDDQCIDVEVTQNIMDDINSITKNENN